MPKVGLSICFNHVGGGGGGGDVLHDPISPHPSTPLRKQTRVHNNEEKGMHFQLTLQVLTCKST